MYSICIENVSAILYKGNAPIGAHAGNSDSIAKWIEEVQSEVGQCKVYGWHRLEVLKRQEEVDERKAIKTAGN